MSFNILKIIFSADKETCKGALGSALSVVSPLIDNMSSIFQFAGALGGLILVLYSIKHKRLQIKQLKSTDDEKT